MPVLRFTVHQAEFPKRASINKTDAYVLVRCGEEYEVTAVRKIKDETLVTFEETFSFQCALADEVTVQLWDKDRITKDDLLAEGGLSCESIVKSYGLRQHILSLYGKKHTDLYALVSATIQ
eukprot:Gregarina_sp_Pseudo_9__3389@NODE_3562_length_612_cov_89_706806_g3256_i0_p1_GENE_NODE_3562_length_612_cov_89_706806_g3256_i0NODE_3562_length_612_cov_89_706806_g3256_i0_p1_ORF_typecomplete_len129_score19_39C2/PF00168_30/9_1e11CC2D2ANC2/PF15625_6/0_0045TTR52/PF01060_23/7_8e03TTR52/PF01060_23/0_01_NODE_3562_length_612_cov_89_706806_g3256_i0225587